MSKKCAKCDKTVYQAEELKCLDKIWHKGCFKCTECGTTLNLKNYVGFNKFPYCSAHNPSKSLTATVVTETPESQRISQMTKLNSGVEYRKDFEKSKGTALTVADDPSYSQPVRQASIGSSGFNYSGGVKARPPPTNNNEEYEIYQNEPSIPAPSPVQLPYPKQQQQSQWEPPAQPAPTQAPRAPSKPLFRAIYDYDAQDNDEVSFYEGDIIEDFTIIDEGWGTGVIRSTGSRGLIPSNYVEPC